MTDPQEELVNILHTGSFLLDTSGTAERDLKNVLVRRLTQYHQALGSSSPSLDTAEDAQLETAQCALHVVERVQFILDQPDLCTSRHEGDLKGAPTIGTRDLSTLRTLLSLIFRWGTETLYTRLSPLFSSKPTPGTPKIIDLTNTPTDHATLSEMLLRLMGLLFPRGPKSTPPQTLISSTLLSRHAVDLLRPTMALGWLPSAPVEPLRPLVLRLLAFIPLPQLMSSLAAVLSTPNSSPPPHVRKLCSSLLTQYFLRPDGVRALCAAVFGELDAEEEPELDKLEHVARVLGTVPRGMQPKDYFQTITPRVLALISSASTPMTPPAFKRAAAFTLARMLDSSAVHHALVASIALPILHDPLSKFSDEASHHQGESGQSQLLPTPSSSLQTIHTLLLSTDPSPSLFSSLLSPILTSLYSLHAHFSKMGVADPVLKEDVWTLMRTWGRVVEEVEGIRVLWSLVDENENSSGGWEGGSAEDLKRVRRVNREDKLALLTPEDLRYASAAEDTDIESLDLGLYPPPAHFVSYIKSIDRADIAGGVFVRLLEAYRTAKESGSADAQDGNFKGETQSILLDPKEPDPLRMMLLLQLIIAFQSQLDNTAILNRPRDVLEFVRHALEVSDTPFSALSHAVSGTPNRGTSNESRKGLMKEDLRIVPEELDDLETEQDSDDEDVGVGEVEGEDMVETAVGLLLAVLEANPSLTPDNTPSLTLILVLLEAHTSTRPSAREARLVLTARMAEGALAASGSAPKYTKKGRSDGKNEDEDTDPRETYQKALKLLQDPLLPVRAHGLLLLRELVSSPARASESWREREAIIRALHPAILSIFLQAIQEDDSYVFLNAVQGLAALVHAPGPRFGAGNEVLKALLDAYARGAEDLADDAESDKKPKDGERGKTKGKGKQMSEVDTRLRVGEALAVVVRRCGDALGVYADTLLPPLLSLLRKPRAPVVLRTSAISLLSECVNTCARVVERYTGEIAEGMLDLVIVEMTVATPTLRPTAKVEGKKTDKDTEVSTGKPDAEPTPTPQPQRPPDPLDISPLNTSPKVPALRRAALHFLALLVRALMQEAYERGGTGGGSWSGVQIRGIYGGQTGAFTADEGGSLPPGFIRRARTVLGYIAAVDEDTVVRVMAREVGEGLEGLEKALVWL
ncbi:uncharacterized protein EDB91DRAFT_1101110 [Suillus paluster]|uniref:uncharacterized protein n=1 Tax=Suillus paluster TaxID=48578 RepID=UPI001B87435C|nr:uncharacterized protein EDB91DRAFT_1101110 [Suillus paluster]KAG1754005.1 hypothetical protein EDB91DRAFT_1101110 [Suillus paluster]